MPLNVRLVNYFSLSIWQNSFDERKNWREKQNLTRKQQKERQSNIVFKVRSLLWSLFNGDYARDVPGKSVDYPTEPFSVDCRRMPGKACKTKLSVLQRLSSRYVPRFSWRTKAINTMQPTRPHSVSKEKPLFVYCCQEFNQLSQRQNFLRRQCLAREFF